MPLSCCAWTSAPVTEPANPPLNNWRKSPTCMPSHGRRLEWSDFGGVVVRSPGFLRAPLWRRRRRGLCDGSVLDEGDFVRQVRVGGVEIMEPFAGNKRRHFHGVSFNGDRLAAGLENG